MNKTLMTSALVLAVATIVSFVIIQNKEETLVSGLQAQIGQTREEMKTTAKTTGLAQVDTVADSIIKDCSVRDRYETLLGRLDALSQSELVEVKQLHAQCSQYYPAQKALMVNRLETQFANYEDLISVLEELRTVDEEEYKTDAWRSLIAKEAARSELLRKQHDIQGRIIDELVSTNRDGIKPLLDEAKKIADSLNVTSIQINNERDALLNI